MKLTKKLSILASAATLCFTAGQSVAQAPAESISELLTLVEEARLTQTEEQAQRLITFRNNVNQQQALLNDVEQQQAREEQISADLENAYNENELVKAQLFETRTERLGDLDELFGTMNGVVGDTRSTFESSLISAQYPGRDEFLSDLAGILASDSDLPSTEELERMWFYMLQEISESGSLVKFQTDVAQPDGTTASQEVVRIGAFNIISGGDYLRYDSETARLSVLAKQPDAYVGTAADMQSASAGTITQMGIDPTGPTGGSLLRNLINSPDLSERIAQGGTIGYIILAFGAVALLLALERIITLTLTGAKVSSQLKNPNSPKKNNPLGRVLMVYSSDKAMDIETLELKLGESILQETPKLERFLTILKIISTVAPLGGLLGTVTGMINVFQAITLYGTGDPQVMAGGISGALVTTVLGLVVAIPTVLLHTFVKSRSDRIIQVLEEQATGMIARKAEGA